ncbi:MAG: DoxX family protein [Planctomycetota bacterium]
MQSSSPRTSSDLALLAMRVMIGVVFVFHGSQKAFGLFDGVGFEGFKGWISSLNVPMPAISAALAVGAELLGGLAFLTGFAMRLMSLPMAFTMLVAITQVHWKNGFYNNDPAKHGYEFPLTLMVMILGLALLGPGRFALRTGKQKAR